MRTKPSWSSPSSGKPSFSGPIMPLSGVSTKLACSALRLILAPDTSPDGEFGPTYVDTDTKGHEEINAQRYELLQEQLRLYDTYPNISWTVWCWKDIGICGVVHPNPDSKYMKLIKPFLEHKKVCTRRSAEIDQASKSGECSCSMS
jgi:hypothetical protein